MHFSHTICHKEIQWYLVSAANISDLFLGDS